MIKFEDILSFVKEHPDHVLATSWGEMLEDSELDFGYDPDYYTPREWLDEAEEHTIAIMSDREWNIYLGWRLEKDGWPKTKEWPDG